MKYKGYIIYETKSGGKAGKLYNKYASIQVREPFGEGYLMKKNFLYQKNASFEKENAIEKAKFFIDNLISEKE